MLRRFEIFYEFTKIRQYCKGIYFRSAGARPVLEGRRQIRAGEMSLEKFQREGAVDPVRMLGVIAFSVELDPDMVGAIAGNGIQARAPTHHLARHSAAQ